MTETWTTRPIDPPDAKRVREVWRGGNEHHTLAIAEYLFDGGHTALYVEASESHNGAHGARVTALSEAVHLLQNVSAGELFAIGNREAPVADLRAAAIAAQSAMAEVLTPGHDGDEESGRCDEDCQACAIGAARAAVDAIVASIEYR